MDTIKTGSQITHEQYLELGEKEDSGIDLTRNELIAVIQFMEAPESYSIILGQFVQSRFYSNRFKRILRDYKKRLEKLEKDPEPIL